MKIIKTEFRANKPHINNQDFSVTKEGNYITYTLKRAYTSAFGFGEKYDHVNHLGKRVVVSVRERCFYQDDFTYLTFPFMITHDGFGLFVDTDNYVEYDLTEKDTIKILVEIESDNIPLLYLFDGNPKAIIKQFKSVVGQTKLFPKWVFGAWISSNRWMTQEHIDEQIQYLDDTKVPHSVMVIERWSDLTTFHYWKGSKYELKTGDKFNHYEDMEMTKDIWSSPREMVKSLHERDIKVLLWDLPMFATKNSVENPNPEQRFLDNEYILENKLSVMKEDGTPYYIPQGNWFNGSLVPDFTNPKTVEYWFNHRKHLDEIGIDGYKTDGGEFIYEKDALFSDGRTGVSMKNGYGDLYAKAYHDNLRDDQIIFTRTGSSRIANYTITWAGDQESTWQEMNSILKAGISAGLSGISNWGFDIAGFGGYLPSKGLYARGIQLGSLVPIMQWHSEPITNGRIDFTGAYKNNDRSPWNMAEYHKSPAYLQMIKKQFDLHYNLIPYFYDLSIEAHREGVPALRHMVFEFADVNVVNLEKQYMLGSALLVAPVLEDYLESISVYLPEDTWYDLYTGQKIEKTGWIDVKITEDKIPVFMRNNQILPLNLDESLKLGSHVGNDLTKYNQLTFIITGEGSYQFKDDLNNIIDIQWTKDNINISRNDLDQNVNIIRMEDVRESLW